MQAHLTCSDQKTVQGYLCVTQGSASLRFLAPSHSTVGSNRPVPCWTHSNVWTFYITMLLLGVCRQYSLPVPCQAGTILSLAQRRKARFKQPSRESGGGETEMQQGLCSDPQNAQARSSIELSPAFQSQSGTKLTGGPQTPEYAFCGQAALSTQGI